MNKMEQLRKRTTDSIAKQNKRAEEEAKAYIENLYSLMEKRADKGFYSIVAEVTCNRAYVNIWLEKNQFLYEYLEPRKVRIEW